MSNANEIRYYSVVDNKRALKQLKTFEKTLQRHQQRVSSIEIATVKKVEAQQLKSTEKVKRKVEQSERTKQSAKTRSMDKALREAKKAAAAKTRQLEKERIAQKRFEAWKTRQFRSAAFSRLNIHEQMELKRVLSSTKAEQDIRDEFAKTTAMMRRAKAIEASRSKKSRSLNTPVAAGAGAGGGAALMIGNPVAMAIGTAVVGGGMMVASGSQEYKDRVNNAEALGVDANDLARFQSGVAGTTDLSKEASVDLLQDIQDRKGEASRDLEMGKDGQFTGGGGSVDLANLLLDEGKISSKADFMELLSGDAIDVAKKLAEITKDMDSAEATFVKESFASNLNKAGAGINQTEKFTNAANTAVTFDEFDTAKADAFNKAMSNFGNILVNLPMTAFKELSNSLSPESLEMFGTLGETLKLLVGIFMDMASVVFNLLAPALNVLLKGLNDYLGFLKKAWSFLADLSSKAGAVFGDILDVLYESFKGMINDIIDFIPDWLKPDWAKDDAPKGDSGKGDTSTTPSNVIPIKPNGFSYNIPQPPTVQRSQAVGYGTQYSSNPSTKVENNNSTTVVLELDGDVVAQKVSNSNAMTEVMGRYYQEVSSGNY